MELKSIEQFLEEKYGRVNEEFKIDKIKNRQKYIKSEAEKIAKSKIGKDFIKLLKTDYLDKENYTDSELSMFLSNFISFIAVDMIK